MSTKTPMTLRGADALREELPRRRLGIPSNLFVLLPGAVVVADVEAPAALPDAPGPILALPPCRTPLNGTHAFPRIAWA